MDSQKHVNNKRLISGFTIIELVVVIVVIGILTSLTMVIYAGIKTKVIDSSLSSDIDRLNAAELNYRAKLGVSGKVYYGSGTDADLNFKPNNGNIFEVVINDTDYCIRGYNVNGTKNTISNSLFKESTPGVCDPLILPSAH